jgi:hypothetical protein
MASRRSKGTLTLAEIQPVLDTILDAELSQAVRATWWLWLFCQKYPSLDRAARGSPREELFMEILYLNGTLVGEQHKRREQPCDNENGHSD